MSRFVKATYAGLVLDVLSSDDDLTRTISRSERATGDITPLHDRGRGPRTTRWDVEFFRRPGEDEAGPLRRRAELLALVDAPGSRLLQHPIDGTWSAVIERASSRMANGALVVDVMFVEDTERTRRPPETTPTRAAAAQAVSAARDELEAALTELNLSGTAGDKAASAADAWTVLEEPIARDVTEELNARTAELAAEAESLSVTGDHSRYSLHLAYQAVTAALASSAAATMRDRGGLTTDTVVEAIPLLAYCADLYGGENALQAYSVIMALNTIDTPLCVPAGLQLTLPTLEALLAA